MGLVQQHMFVGNLGDDQWSAYNAIGSDVATAWLLEQLNKQLGTDILMTDAVQSEAKFHFQCCQVDILCFSDGSKCKVHHLVKENESAQDEWMYELQQAEKSDPLRDLHVAWKLLAEGTNSKAVDALRVFLETNPEHATAHHLMKAITYLEQRAPSERYSRRVQSPWQLLGWETDLICADINQYSM
eukprot:NODE_2490_length_917_cov_76.076037_g2045_i0.p1 GENE.NODE_2490_length_917_cov_76.076037_g2045_i0~~NODE_2490_length_917_cov_76.076037_g2045_i0.p1  ORF type:complete len:186 (+),score=40.24 NODE_2490_length_917_cov_76.076037_g2045_i0:289-846(+)